MFKKRDQIIIVMEHTEILILTAKEEKRVTWSFVAVSSCYKIIITVLKKD